MDFVKIIVRILGALFWKQRCLIEMLAQPITDGPHETPNLVKRGIPFISVEAVMNNRLDFTRKRGFISSEYNDQCNKKYKPQLHDVYLVKSGSTVGKVAIVETNMVFNIWSPLAAMRVNEFNNAYFLYYLLQTDNLQDQIKKKSKGGTQPNLSMRILEKCITNSTNLKEETQIALILNKVDKLLLLQQRKLEQLKSIKKAMLQKLFVNKDMPILHFKGFNNIWKRSKLGNITKTISSKPYISGAYEEGKYEVVQQGDHPIAGYSNDIPFKNYKDVTLFGDHTLSLFKPRKAFLIASDGIKILSPSVTMDSLFYYYLLEKYKPRSEGYKRHFSILKKGVALFPVSINEQTQIAHVLIIIDKTISLQQERIEKLRNYKQFILQNMLI